MKPHFIALAALAAASLIAFAQPVSQLPAPWLLSGESPGRYTAGVDQDGHQSGTKDAKFLRYASGGTGSWATLMQQFSAENYRGKRIRFDAEVMTHDTGGAALWMRVDSKRSYATSFYNSSDKVIYGTVNWERRSVVLDVDADATVISLGVIGYGGGESWLRNMHVEEVGKDVPVDVMPNAAAAMRKEPSL